MGQHKISAMAGYSYEYNVGENMWAFNYNFPTDVYTYNNLGMGYAVEGGKASMGSDMSESKLIGFFGRLTYGYADRYNVLASIRREGSSKFGKNYRWGVFPALSLGWTK